MKALLAVLIALAVLGLLAVANYFRQQRRWRQMNLRARARYLDTEY